MQWQSYALDLACTRCNRTRELGGLNNLCDCGAPLSTRYDLPKAQASWDRDALERRETTLWRYHELLPLLDPRFMTSLGEGMTPLLELPRLAKRLECRKIYLKDESFNPTNSFKARGMALAVSKARELGLQHLALPSAGNAGCAAAAYAARAGMRATVFVPRDTGRSFIEECVVMGAEVELIDGLIDDCGRIVAQQKERKGWFDVSTLKEPYRLEGKKTLGYELAQQLGWHLPDVIVYPTGGGTGLIGMWKAFRELESLGWLEESSLPRMVCVQADGCAPMVRAFHAGQQSAPPWPEAQTFALGLRVPAAVGDFLILQALRESGGTAVAVSDAAIGRAGRDLALDEGIFACPEGAATWAATLELQTNGFLRPEDRVVLFNTGGWYKYAPGWRRMLGLL